MPNLIFVTLIQHLLLIQKCAEKYMRVAKIQIMQGFQRKKHGFLKTGLVEFGKNLRKALNYAL